MSNLPDPPNEEGPKAAERFKAAMKQILSVPKAEIERREEEYQKQRLLRKTDASISEDSRLDPA